MPQEWSPDGVRQERTAWRDERISQRHRRWGFNCPCVDLDFLVAEYNVGKPVALIEYKHFKARQPDVEHATYRALKELADGYLVDGLPFLIAFYWPDIWAFKTQPVNDLAIKWFAHDEIISEYEYVQRLYKMRRKVLTKELEKFLNRTLPPAEAA